MRLFALTIFAICLFGGPVSAETGGCITIIDHSKTHSENPWRTVNDTVMGGRSSGGSSLENGIVSFTGSINTNGGGFSSMNIPVARGVMAQATGIKVYMQRDAREYAITLRTNARSFGRRIAFRSPITGAPSRAWGTGEVSFDTLKASIWGRAVRNAVFDPAEVVQLGIIIYDGIDGPFEMQLQRIEACS